jgi:hypothetical protein
MKNAVPWDMAPCGFIINRPFGGTCRHHLEGKRHNTSEEKCWMVRWAVGINDPWGRGYLVVIKARPTVVYDNSTWRHIKFTYE